MLFEAQTEIKDIILIFERKKVRKYLWLTYNSKNDLDVDSKISESLHGQMSR